MTTRAAFDASLTTGSPADIVAGAATLAAALTAAWSRFDDIGSRGYLAVGPDDEGGPRISYAALYAPATGHEAAARITTMSTLTSAVNPLLARSGPLGMLLPRIRLHVSQTGDGYAAASIHVDDDDFAFDVADIAETVIRAALLLGHGYADVPDDPEPHTSTTWSVGYRHDATGSLGKSPCLYASTPEQAVRAALTAPLLHSALFGSAGPRLFSVNGQHDVAVGALAALRASALPYDRMLTALTVTGDPTA